MRPAGNMVGVGSCVVDFDFDGSPRNVEGDLMWNQVNGTLARAVVGLQAVIRLQHSRL